MHAQELRKYKKLPVEKRKELQTPSTGVGAVIPGAGGFEGDFVDYKQPLTPGQSCRFACTKPTVVF